MTTSLADWLDYISTNHPADIDLGLDRAGEVFNRLIPGSWQIPTITVAGTNGKGSTVAYLDALARAAEMNVLSFTSPHLIDYRERLQQNGHWLSETLHVQAFQAIATAAGDIPLTYFEFSTLSAFYLAKQLDVDLLILEVGLGGRLDATNLVAADIAIITTIGLDHQEYLGNTIDAIAREKLGIVHPSSRTIIADDTVPEDLISGLKCHEISRYGIDYSCHEQRLVLGKSEFQLPDQIKPVTNSASALVAFSTLAPQLDLHAVNEKANQLLNLPGRMQQLRTDPVVIADVAHNPQAFNNLVQQLASRGHKSYQIVLGMLADKQVDESLEILMPYVSHWHLAVLDSPRAMAPEQISSRLEKRGIPLANVSCYASVQEAYDAATSSAYGKQQTLLVTGSFYTVGPVLKQEQIHVQ
jgi:dihydrofolate synthase/folylpolyglutamate synthase